MKISMWILLNELKNLDPSAEITDGSMQIETLQVSYDPDPRDIDADSRIVYIFQSGCDVLLANGPDRIRIPHEKPINIVNHIIRVFDSYYDWEHRLLSACLADTPFQAILDIAHEKFLCPMMVGRIDRHILALTKQYTSDQVYDEWEDLKQFGTIPFKAFTKLKKMNFPLDSEGDFYKSPQAVEPVWPSMHFAHQIRTNIYIQGVFWGLVYIYSYDETIPKALLQLAAYVAHVFEWLVTRQAETLPMKYLSYSWLIDTLEGKEINLEGIKALYEQNGWRHSDPLVLIRIAYDDDAVSDDPPRFTWICDDVSLFPNTVAFPYHHSIVVITRSEEKNYSYVIERLQHILSATRYRFGVSLPFQGMSRIGSFYQQASFAYDRAADSDIVFFCFKDCLISGMMKHLRDLSPDWRSYVLPELLKMARENTYGPLKDLYTTLCCYLRNNNTIADSARELNTHRNTIVYRLGKIRNALQLDIDDPQNRVYLFNATLLLDMAGSEPEE